MLNNAKALVVVLALALLTFHLCKPIAVQFMREETFARRRNVWVALTTVAFLSPNFWIWAIFALVLLFWAGRRDRNPLAVYCIAMFAVPHVSFYIPAPLVNQLFELTPARILSLAVVVPALVRERSEASARPGFTRTDAVLLAFVVLQIALLVPYETVTNTMRRSLLLVIDSLIVLYAFSRLAGREHLQDTVACFWLAVVVMAPMALFESVRGWLLYTGIGTYWGDPNTLAWLFRAGSLRAQVAAGHSINFGYHVAMALTLYLFLRTRRAVHPVVDAALLTTMAGAIIVSYSRGAWVTAAIGVVVYLVLRPDAARHAASALAAVGAFVVVLFVTPLRQKVIDRLPFIGTAEQETIEYRERLSETSWAIVDQNPWFGDPFATLKMEALRQGQGIIDIVNGYLFTALFTGYVGLALLCSLFVLATLAGYRALRVFSKASDADGRATAAVLVACMVATAAYIATAGHGTTTFILCGLLSSAGLAALRPRTAPQAAASRTLRAVSA